MAYGGSFTCPYCFATFSWYTGTDRKTKEDARRDLEDHLQVEHKDKV